MEEGKHEANPHASTPEAVPPAPTDGTDSGGEGAAEFIPAVEFAGARSGYVYKMGRIKGRTDETKGRTDETKGGQRDNVGEVGGKGGLFMGYHRDVFEGAGSAKELSLRKHKEEQAQIERQAQRSTKAQLERRRGSQKESVGQMCPPEGVECGVLGVVALAEVSVVNSIV
jgi:hypothetical protein